ncbi:MAG: two-component regulator propeller domain-containing protein [Anditalea sp.]
MKQGAGNAFMRTKSKWMLLCLLLTGWKLCSAQGDIPVGSWRFHQSYLDIKNITGSESTLFALGDHSLFYYSLSDLKAKALTKTEGLYAQHLSAMAYSTVYKVLLLAYPDGTIDLVGENKIQRIDDIRLNTLLSKKRVNQIKIEGNTAWIAADFGIAQINLNTGQLTEAYLNIGPEGSPLAISDVAIGKNEILITSISDIFIGSKTANLKDFRNWIPVPPIDALSFPRIVIQGNTVFALGTDQKIYMLQNGILEWIIGTMKVIHFKVIENQLFFGTENTIYKMEENGSYSSIKSGLEQQYNDFHFAQNNLFLATSTQGVLSISTQESLFANGPLSQPQAFKFVNKHLLAVSNHISAQGGIKTSPGQAVSQFTEWRWEKLTAPEGVVSAAFHKGELYFGTLGDGIYKIKDELITKMDIPNLPLNATISDLAMDPSGNLWMSIWDYEGRLFKLDPTGAINRIAVPGLSRPVKILPDRAGNLWVIQQNAGGRNLRVFNESNDLNRTFGEENNQGNLPANQVLSLDLDRLGNLWIGTTKGVAYFPYVAGIDPSSAVNAVLPLFEDRPLLRNKPISSIFIAPDDSKWFGTEQDGIWHFTEDAATLLSHFTRSNSPLPSNTIHSMTMDLFRGEIFFITLEGAISYRSGSIQAAENLTDLKIFPNPVRPDYGGALSIEGLTDFSYLKITTAVGRVIASMVVQGGKIIWNLRDASGRKVAPGIYMVYVMDKSGGEKIAGKFLVM